MSKKIAIIGIVGLPAKYGGFETLVEQLTKNIGTQLQITVFCSSKSYKNKLDEYNGAKLKYVNLKANGFQSILYDIVSIIKSLKDHDVLLILGVSGCIVLPFVKLFSSKKIVVNIDGIEWKREKWGKITKKFLRISEKLAVKYSHEVIADNKIIKDYVEKEYGISSHLITYGADHVEKELIDDEIIKLYPFLSCDYAFKVCRIEPENNIHLILQAFSKLPEKIIVIIGNWNNSSYGKELILQYSQFKNIFLLNPIYDQKVLNQIRSNCFIYIHGHSAGGTNPSLVEAMHLNLPIIAFSADYNKETTRQMAYYFSNENELRELLKNFNFEEGAIVANNMRSIAVEDYNWIKICEKYNKVLN
jgi:glycosyltransferase involved in cell wall biosynthesis